MKCSPAFGEQRDFVALNILHDFRVRHFTIPVCVTGLSLYPYVIPSPYSDSHQFISLHHFLQYTIMLQVDISPLNNTIWQLS